MTSRPFIFLSIASFSWCFSLSNMYASAYKSHFAPPSSLARARGDGVASFDRLAECGVLADLLDLISDGGAAAVGGPLIARADARDETGGGDVVGHEHVGDLRIV